MKRLILLTVTVLMLTGCYTTFYPPYDQIKAQNMSEIPDSTEKVIINNYYESNDYYQMPGNYRYSLLWNDYYWDPFYYDYSYYNWRPYYWYGSYYFYNPRSDYWFYYWYYNGDNSGYNPGGETPSEGNANRVRKPGYTQLSGAPSSTPPYISVDPPNKKPGYRVDPSSNIGIGNSSQNSNYPRIESVGKKSVNSSGSDSYIRKRTNTNTKNKKSSQSTGSYNRKSSNSSRSSYSKPSSSKKQSKTSSSTKKSSSNKKSNNSK